MKKIYDEYSSHPDYGWPVAAGPTHADVSATMDPDLDTSNRYSDIQGHQRQICSIRPRGDDKV